MITIIATIFKGELKNYELQAGLALDTIVQILLLVVAMGWLR